MKQLLFFFLVFLGLCFSFTSPVYANTGEKDSDEVQYHPLLELLDLHVNGTANSIIGLNQPFSKITGLVLQLEFVATSFDWDAFGGESTALTNGIDILYNGISLLQGQNITKNSDFPKLAIDFSYLKDNTANVNNVLRVAIEFQEPILITQKKTLQFYIGDDLTTLSSIKEFQATVKGFQRVVTTFFVVRDEFYPNAINKIVLKHLVPGLDYQLKVNSSARNAEVWVNDTALTNQLTIDLYYEFVEEVTVIHFYLYEEGQFVQQRDLFVRNGSLEFIDVWAGLVSFIGLAVLGLLFYMLFTGAKPKFRGRL